MRRRVAREPDDHLRGGAGAGAQDLLRRGQIARARLLGENPREHPGALEGVDGRRAEELGPETGRRLGPVRPRRRVLDERGLARQLGGDLGRLARAAVLAHPPRHLRVRQVGEDEHALGLLEAEILPEQLEQPFAIPHDASLVRPSGGPADLAVLADCRRSVPNETSRTDTRAGLDRHLVDDPLDPLPAGAHPIGSRGQLQPRREAARARHRLGLLAASREDVGAPGAAKPRAVADDLPARRVERLQEQLPGREGDAHLGALPGGHGDRGGPLLPAVPRLDHVHARRRPRTRPGRGPTRPSGPAPASAPGRSVAPQPASPPGEIPWISWPV